MWKNIHCISSWLLFMTGVTGSSVVHHTLFVTGYSVICCSPNITCDWLLGHLLLTTHYLWLVTGSSVVHHTLFVTGYSVICCSPNITCDWLLGHLLLTTHYLWLVTGSSVVHHILFVTGYWVICCSSHILAPAQIKFCKCPSVIYYMTTWWHWICLECFINYSQTCMKRPPLGQRKSDLIRQVTSIKRLNSYEIFYDRTRKRWPFNTGDRTSKFDC